MIVTDSWLMSRSFTRKARAGSACLACSRKGSTEMFQNTGKKWEVKTNWLRQVSFQYSVGYNHLKNVKSHS